MIKADTAIITRDIPKLIAIPCLTVLKPKWADISVYTITRGMDIRKRICGVCIIESISKCVIIN